MSGFEVSPAASCRRCILEGLMCPVATSKARMPPAGGALGAEPVAAAPAVSDMSWKSSDRDAVGKGLAVLPVPPLLLLLLLVVVDWGDAVAAAAAAGASLRVLPGADAVAAAAGDSLCCVLPVLPVLPALPVTAAALLRSSGPAVPFLTLSAASSDLSEFMAGSLSPLRNAELSSPVDSWKGPTLDLTSCSSCSAAASTAAAAD
jgi:hypothetical protein